jgi:outer membrane protein assembly factor BamB
MTPFPEKRAALLLPLLVALALLAIACGGVSNPDGWARPVVADGTLYVSLDGGELTAIALEAESNAGCNNKTDDDDDGRVNEGCPQVDDLAEFGDQCENDTSDDAPAVSSVEEDDAVNDGCPARFERWTFAKNDEFACGNADKKRWDLRAIYGTPVIDGDRVYLGAYDGNVYAVSRSDGSCLWAFEGSDGPIIGGLALADGVLWAPSDDGQLYGLDPEDGVLKKGPFDAGDAIWATPLIVDDAIYFATVSGKMWALTVPDLHRKWTFETSAGLIMDPTIAGDVVVVGGIGGKLFGLDAETGETIWGPSSGGNWFWGRALLDNEILYVPNLDHKIYAIDANTGERVWDKPLEAEEAIRSSPTLVDGVLTVVDRRGNVFFVDPATGLRKRDPILFDAKVLADQIEFEGKVLVLTQGGGLHELDPAEGTLTRLEFDR